MSSHGIVVQNKENGVRFATLDENFDGFTQDYVRDLRIGESVYSYQPKNTPQGTIPSDQSVEDPDPLVETYHEPPVALDELEDPNTGDPDLLDGFDGHQED